MHHPAITTLSPAPHCGIARYATLRAAGFSRNSIESLTNARHLSKVRRGWYATRDAPKSILAAVALHGQLTGTAGLAAIGKCWLDPRAEISVALPPHAQRPPTSKLSVDNRAVHVTYAPSSRLQYPVRSPLQCVEDATREPFEHALAPIESAIFTGVISLTETIAVLSNISRGHRLLKWLDPSAESGLETLMRTRLQRRGVKLTPQYQVPDVGRIDLLVGDRLIIECDGATYHDGIAPRAADYRRDRRLRALGFLPLRFSYAQIIYEWQTTEEVLLNLIQRRRHRYQGTRNRALVHH